MTYDTLTLKFDAHIAAFAFDRPDKRNAVTAAMIQHPGRPGRMRPATPHRHLTGAGRRLLGPDLTCFGDFQTSAAENLEDSRLITAFRRVWSFPGDHRRRQWSRRWRF
jgi:enoyl-CoA hydratase/carnithine racemase